MLTYFIYIFEAGVWNAKYEDVQGLAKSRTTGFLIFLKE